MTWEQDLREYAEDTEIPAPTPGEAAALIHRAQAHRRPARRAIQWGIPVLAAAAAAWLLFANSPPPEVPTAPPVAKATAQPAPIPDEWLAPGRQVLGDDVVQVASASQVRVIEQGANTILSLEAGKVHLEVAKRKPNAHFKVASGEWTVSVVGTSFSVQHAPFEVTVFSGIVDVLRGEQRWRLRAADRFADGKLIRPEPEPEPAASPAPSLDTIRDTIVSGDIDQARTALLERLTQHPEDIENHTLMAQLESRAGNPSAAITHWTTVTTRGTPSSAQRAHYEIALLSKDNPAATERHLRAFLERPNPLAPDARLRLARALLAQDRTTEATTELNQILRDHPGTTPARIARNLLNTF